MIALGYTARRQRRPVRTTALWRLLGPRAAFCLDVRFLIGIEKDLIQHCFLEADPRICVTVEFSGRTLSSAPGPDILTFPVSFGERRVAVLVPVGCFLQQLLLRSNGKSVDDGLHTRRTAGDDHCLVGFGFRIHPARQLHDPLVDRANIDRTFAQNRIVAERFENALW